MCLRWRLGAVPNNLKSQIVISRFRTPVKFLKGRKKNPNSMMDQKKDEGSRHYLTYMDVMIEQLARWIEIAPVEYPEEWRNLQIMLEKGRERRRQAAKRKAKRLGNIPPRRKS